MGVERPAFSVCQADSPRPLGPRPSPATPGVCYSALRRLPRRDLHPLEKNSVMRAAFRPHRHDALYIHHK